MTKQSFIIAFVLWVSLGMPAHGDAGFSDALDNLARSPEVSGRSGAIIDPSGAEAWLRRYGLLVAVGLAMVAVVIRRMKALLGFDPALRLRRRAADRILSAMCHVAKTDGVTGAAEVALIADTARHLTGRTYLPADIRGRIGQDDPGLAASDFTAFGQGLRDHEKDMMLRAVLSIAMASGRIFPQSYNFSVTLAQGLGIPARDFRRVLGLAIADMNTRGM